MVDVLWWISGALGVALLLVVLLAREVGRLRTKLRTLDTTKRSQSTRYGQTMEQLAPFLAGWPGDPKRFKFLGDPIDGIQFNEDEVLFIEIKSARSQLSAVQRRTRDLVQAGRVRFVEIRID